MYRKTLKENAFEKIRSDIVANRLKPGQYLNEQELSNKLNISKTPIREAIQMLSREGFVQIIPQKGCFVAPLTFSDIKDLMQMSEALKGIAAGIAAKQHDKKKLQVFEKKFAAIRHREKKDYKTGSALMEQFDSFLIESTRNKRLREIFENINIHLDRIRATFSVQYPDNYHKQVLSEHMKILKAVKAGNVLDAEKAMRQSIRNFWEILKTLL